MCAKINPSAMNIAVLCGGTSGEREISLASGKGAKEALETAGFNVTVLDTAKTDALITLMTRNFDVAFLALHGKNGEDGTIQGLLEILDIPYTGSGVCSSALAIDKSKAKVFYRKEGIPTPIAMTLTDAHQYPIEELVATVGNRAVVKPSSEGSALGVHIVEGSQAIQDALEEVFQQDSQVLVESYVAGTEMTVPVLGNDEPYALPVIQIIPSNDFYDFESKYAPGGSKHLCPAPLPDEVTQNAQMLAVAAHKALGCAGVSRTDMILDEEGKLWVLETNTIPGMTATSLLPDSAKAAGMSFAELCTQLVEFALEK